MDIKISCRFPVTANPFYWGAFFNVGDNGPVLFQKVYYKYVFFSLGLLLFICAGLLFIKKRTNAKKTRQENPAEVPA